MLNDEALFELMVIAPPAPPVEPAALADTVLENPAVVQALTDMLPPAPPLAPAALADSAPETVMDDAVDVNW